MAVNNNTIIKYKIGKCPKCQKLNKKLMFSNNPLSGEADSNICFDCIKSLLKADNIEHADFFCRTYNLPFDPSVWINLYDQFKEDVFEKYTTYCLEEATDKKNLYYTSSTHDIWSRINKEWEKTRSFITILNKIEPIRESYVERGRIKWGEQYDFSEIFKLDSMYVRTLRANNITDPMQKEAIKTLCKLHIEMDEAIKMKDAKAMRDFASTYSAFAKEAKLDMLINESKTDDITTVAELYKYMEDSGFIFKFYDNHPRDEVDRTIKDLQNSSRRLIVEATGLEQQLSDMIKKKTEKNEEQYMEEITSKQSMQEFFNIEMLEDNNGDASADSHDDSEDLLSDEDIQNIDFSEDADAYDLYKNTATVIVSKDKKDKE